MPVKIPAPIHRILQTTSFWRENSFLIREFKYFGRAAIFAFTFTILAAAFEGFGIGFILTFLQSLTHPDSAQLHTGIAWIDNVILGVNAPVNERLFRISGLILLTTFLRLGFSYLGKLYTRISASSLAYRLRRLLFEQLISLRISYFAKKRSGEIINSLTSEVIHLQHAFDISSTLLTKTITLSVYLFSMFLLSWQLTLVSGMLFSLLSIGISTLLGRIREASFEKSKASGRYTSVALELVNGIRTVHAFAAEDFERKRFYGANQNLLNATLQAISAQALVEPLREGIATTILIGMLVVAVTTLIPRGYLELASLLTFLFVLFRMMPTLRQIDGSRVQMSGLHGSLRDIKELLRKDDKAYTRNGKQKFTNLKQAIEYVAVDFGYDADEPVLHNISLSIKKGEMTALVGSSGAGKSTLADLIPRFYDPTAGQILVDGVDLREFEISSLRRKLAVVSQDTFIFNTSVRDNIAYALEDVDEAAVWEAARLANALDFIQELPQGFDTQLGDRGVRLSGGQRQRIAIARALLRNPEILILDEATSALDSVSERLIQESLEKLAVGRTVIAIAHRLSTIVRADKVVVLEGGRIIEQGGYQELLSQRGKLWKYHQLQHEMSRVS
ncbi:heterocyst formation ABC transporter subunit HepA [Gloeocapsopsis sp. IPPAS B-1203]|uniref:heterocyst formation ABC transporter subunit HepA n=1 Tax=Gloeocapsopsis sp. IPPAS B-1203 TaxID=2049454 RepID=UPI000C19A2D5|nr:heterocyst formation ABC transporter subunit HepA [Gloeocapsopsis sp. IPPAS B-1203]PIG93891.1 ABC transporter ATP-binding protein [Gloeocapsopsis sp. IPPAS B-1203]